MTNELTTMTPAGLPLAFSDTAPVTPAELLNQFNETIGQVVQDLTSGMRFIGFGGKNFVLREGNTSTTLMHNGVAATHMDLIILNMAADRHCKWYLKDYDPRNPQAAAPDAVWWQKEGPGPNVPAYVTKEKTVKNGMEVNHYQLNQRLVVLRLQTGANGQYLIDPEDLWAMDITGMSIFAKQEQAPYYTFQGLMKYVASRKLLPSAFIVRMIFAQGVSVPCVRFVPMTNKQTHEPMLFDNATYQSLCQLALSPAAKALLEVRTWDYAGAAPANQDSRLVHAEQVKAQADEVARKQQVVNETAAREAALKAEIEARVRAEMAQAPAPVDASADLLSAADALLNEAVTTSAPVETTATVDGGELDVAMAALVNGAFE